LARNRRHSHASQSGPIRLAALIGFCFPHAAHVSIRRGLHDQHTGAAVSANMHGRCRPHTLQRATGGR
jgi:hypothetical protein